jgi:hypothetical protein
MSDIDLEMGRVKLEVQRFLDRIHEFEEHVQAKVSHSGHYACPERAAVKRASLDLTRALSRLRNR